jgi:hypothetical protein
MLTWKRVAITVSLLSIGLAALQIWRPPQVIAQVRPALVRNVDEPARVPYFVQAQPTCPYSNECLVAGPVVPAGKRLRVTRLEGMILLQVPNVIVYLSVNNDNAPVVLFPSSVFNQSFFGSGVSFNQEVDFTFEAGQAPYLCVGTSGGAVSADHRNRYTIAGYLVDIQP